MVPVRAYAIAAVVRKRAMTRAPMFGRDLRSVNSWFD